jgi:alpha-beta hydrolase superfamily lysophospholipase
MPWSRLWNGTVDDAVSAVDALVDLAARSGKKVFVGGQSLGANFTSVYRADNPPPAVIGKVMTNPGGMLDLTAPNARTFWDAFMPSVERARALEKEGKGKERTKFSGTNVQGEKSIEEHYETTPEIFLSFHDMARYPSNRAALRATQLPVFWSSGKKDPIQTGKKQSFNLMPSNPASVYMDLDGDHNSAMMAAIDPVIAWMKARAAS